MTTDKRKLLFLYPKCSSLYKARFFSYTTQLIKVKVDSLCGNSLENTHPWGKRLFFFPV